MPTTSRRQVLAALSGGLAAAGALAAGGLLLAAARARRLVQPVRRVRGRWPADAMPHVEAAVIVVGPAGGGGPAVFDRRCPHLGCLIEQTPVGATAAGFHCPCHGSRFAADGARIEGPAPRGLRRLAARTESDGAWLVDLPEDGP